MKILQVTNFFKPSFEAGGVTRVAYSISKQLVKRGHEVTVFTTNRSSKNINIETNKLLNMEGMKIYYFENLRKYFPIEIPPIPYYLLIINKDEFKNYDIIHIHEHRTLLAIIVSHYARKYSIPYVIQPHGSILPFFQKKNLKKKFDYMVGNRILMHASKVIALNKKEAEQIKKMGVENVKIEIIPNGIDISEYSNLPCKGEFKKKYSIKENERIILYLGRIHKIKGVDLLIEAFSLLCCKLDNIKLVIIGPDNGFLPTLKKQINNYKLENKVLFLGPLYGRDKLEAYVDADVYVLPSRYETFPISVLEAAVCGTPVVITDRCGIVDIVEGKLGYVSEFNAYSLMNTICVALTAGDLNNSFNGAGTQIIDADFSWHDITKKIENTYDTCLKVKIKP